MNKELYLQSISKTSSILIDQNSYLIVKTNEAFYGQLQPAKNDGMVRIFNKEAKLPLYTIHHTAKSSTPDPYIEGLLAQVSGENITASVQHLQEYGTRNAYAPESVEAEQWIYQQFADLGLEVETMDFTMPSGSASDNVIATLTGTKYPNEYVVVGGHYDSVSSSGDAPGADDNASGTAAVIEIARILSSQELDRSIIFCAFSGEEYGLYGSAAFAQQCANQGLNIHGYFNLDMIGYLEEGGTMKSTLIYPQPAQELADFYMNICSIYLPDFIVEPGSFSGGDSDHTSFNNNGYMGIFPFENIDAYSPYIHTSNDIIGPSYNNQDQAVVFTQASLAATVAMANRILPPQNLIAIPQNGSVKLTWNAMADIDSYTIYRNNIAIAWPAENEYIDYAVENGTQYSYFVTAIYSDTQEESDPSNTVTVTPAPPIEIPFAIYFEDGYSHFQIEN
ncbi:MAG TPA: M20/M25/M40 family metallo-hydrolase, partial [Tenuifilaceae bacterium]|nr:M20/M25/M40 family metallo-hydrolase [Tenuifilaceae bacterium]